MRVATWTAGALALGWLAVGLGALVYPRGHPPAWFVIGEGVVMASLVIAPTSGVPRRTWIALALNLVLLLAAVGLWLWLMSVTT